MVGPDDTGGFRVTIPDGDDTIRDMLGLVRAVMADDSEGQKVMLAHADLQPLALTLATALAACLTASVRQHASDPDILASALTAAELDHAMAILIAGTSGPDDDLGGTPW